MQNIKVIAFDADDTLWINEPFFREFEENYFKVLSKYLPEEELKKQLFDLVIHNISLYGYGTRGLSLSMIEGAVTFTNGKVTSDEILQIIELGKKMLKNPIELLDGVIETLEYLKGKYRLVVATKGDLLEQESKVKKSNLEKYFHHIEIVSEKTPEEYSKLIKHLDVEPSEFLMIGNSLKSDIVPVLELGGNAYHVPFHTTWAHEMIDHEIETSNQFKVLNNIADIKNIL
ncbi:HAD hydrolase-like protein [Flammeovirga yaeyamensis]|uniref:HAD hydrolase-like protein n=1 Tax=Flammeovirga yaeyamensis TaxID=367791 RepID=A0AAX1NDW6_9BACT|nr:HAD family hydrolase [Flammeovirga yaeyamensis]MBB3699208.1 putative hydrolase of the HAD superfamily [Flammeovirga yaeyamensis]NMF35528.1 HAD family hydrolase [Flammeovirga yaeyamensis]QWG04387.1 HAD hydrolase-like protein [Flammeovirga yaeyamensis]